MQRSLLWIFCLAIVLSLAFWISTTQQVPNIPSPGVQQRISLQPSLPGNPQQAVSTIASPSSETSLHNTLVSTTSPLPESSSEVKNTIAATPLPAVSAAVGVESWATKLYTPTYITHLFGVWFIVDCWHHRVIYSPELDLPVAAWKDLDAGHEGKHALMKIPHTVTSDGEILLLESSVGGSNGANHSVLVYKPRMVETQTGGGRTLDGFDFIEEVKACPLKTGEGKRPHRLSYDPHTKAFYLYLTSPPTLAKFVRSGPSIVLSFCHQLHFMKNIYARSFALYEGFMYITAGPAVSKVNYADATAQVPVKLVKSYPAKYFGFSKGKMNDLQYLDGWWYATSTVPCGIIRFKDIERIRAERLGSTLGLCGSIPRKAVHCKSGTPYYISQVGEQFFVPFIFGCSGIVSFRLNNSTATTVSSSRGKEEEAVPPPLVNVSLLFGTGWVEARDDVERRGTEW